jgi:cell division protein FtsN
MTSPALSPERRQTPRTTVDRLAYINLDSNNGAIVLNVSGGGLCFHSAAPIQRSETIHFWFSEDHYRIEAEGSLVWMDEKQKTAGLRFTNLSAGARLQIRNWMNQPARPTTAGARTAASISSPPELLASRAKRPDRSASSALIEGRSPSLRSLAVLSGFSAGLVLGILVSAVLAAGFLLRTHRREFANSLIQLGERLGARPQSQTVPPVQQAPPIASVSSPSRVTLPKQPQTRAANPKPAEHVAPAPVSIARASATARTVETPPTPSSPPPPTTLLPKTAVPPKPSDVPVEIGRAPNFETASPSKDYIVDSKAEDTRPQVTTYLEIGKFHEVTWANEATNKVQQLGFPATVVHKGHFWINSYQVLVGPYSNDNDVKSAHAYLESHGFRPRAYERGSRSFWFPAGLTFHGTQIPVNDCVIRWESYVTDAIVKFEKGGSVVATTEGKWVTRSAKYEQNAIVYRKNGDGSRTLLEIRFAGMSRALVFGESS